MAQQIQKISKTEKRRQKFWKLQYKGSPYLFIAPFVISFLVFILYPVLFAAHLSLHEWMGVGPKKWVGLGNYIEMFAESIFHQAMWNSTFYVIGSIILIVPLALILAVLLNSSEVRARNTFRAAFFLPSVIAVVVIAITFQLMYNKDYGIINYFLIQLGIVTRENSPDWLGSVALAKPAILGLVLWRWVGYNMVYFLAGLQGIPIQLYEASKIDGANRLQMFFFITIPQLKPVTIFVVTTAIIGSFQIFAEPFIMTQGGPSRSTLSAVQLIYRTGFQNLEMGMGAAVSFLLFLIIAIVAFTQMKAFNIWEEWA